MSDFNNFTCVNLLIVILLIIVAYRLEHPKKRNSDREVMCLFAKQ